MKGEIGYESRSEIGRKDENKQWIFQWSRIICENNICPINLYVWQLTCGWSWPCLCECIWCGALEAGIGSGSGWLSGVQSSTCSPSVSSLSSAHNNNNNTTTIITIRLSLNLSHMPYSRGTKNRSFSRLFFKFPTIYAMHKYREIVMFPSVK